MLIILKKNPQIEILIPLDWYNFSHSDTLPVDWLPEKVMSWIDPIYEKIYPGLFRIFRYNGSQIPHCDKMRKNIFEGF